MAPPSIIVFVYYRDITVCHDASPIHGVVPSSAEHRKWIYSISCDLHYAKTWKMVRKDNDIASLYRDNNHLFMTHSLLYKGPTSISSSSFFILPCSMWLPSHQLGRLVSIAFIGYELLVVTLTSDYHIHNMSNCFVAGLLDEGFFSIDLQLSPQIGLLVFTGGTLGEKSNFFFRCHSWRDADRI